MPKTNYHGQFRPDGSSHETISQDHNKTRLSWDRDAQGNYHGIHFGNDAGRTQYNNFDNTYYSIMSNPYLYGK